MRLFLPFLLFFSIYTLLQAQEGKKEVNPFTKGLKSQTDMQKSKSLAKPGVKDMGAPELNSSYYIPMVPPNPHYYYNTPVLGADSTKRFNTPVLNREAYSKQGTKGAPLQDKKQAPSKSKSTKSKTKK